MIVSLWLEQLLSGSSEADDASTTTDGSCASSTNPNPRKLTYSPRGITGTTCLLTKVYLGSLSAISHLMKGCYLSWRS